MATNTTTATTTEENTNWQQSAAGIVERDGKILLVRHTYGAGKGRLIIPGGYVKVGETPQEACKREIFEETGVTANPLGIVGIRFNLKDWYAVFAAEYVSGTAHSDNSENSEAVWINARETLERDDVPDLTKKLIAAYLDGRGLEKTEFTSRENHGTYSLYC
jgi:ADP-ribose pyrophosphatase YjhB (NUDIX family)